MPRKPLSLYVFVVVVVRRGFRYLMVEKPGESGGVWYPPAGALLPGEDLVAAAVRETKEEAGIDIDVTGLVAIEHMPRLPGWEFARWRFVLEGRMKRDSPEPFTQRHGDVLKAAFLSPGALKGLRLRGEDATKIIARHADGQPVAPIGIYQLGYS